MNPPTDAVDQLRADYDATPYNSDAFPQSAPGQLAAIAHVFGLDVPDVARARVLEIGCAAGGNLIPFAVAHPAAHVVGIDLSDVQIEQGRRRVRDLGLGNLELVAGDLARMDLAALGRFDFVIAHGVYSWVPPDVGDALLAACRTSLTPNGVAYVSYNAYPGWKAKEVMRDAMLLASGAGANPAEKVREARGMAEFLEGVASADGVLARVLAEFRARDEGFGDAYLLHDELEAFNAPCYFYEMLGRARGHGLEYLAEARPETMFPANHGPKVADYLREKCGDVRDLMEQYLDFVVNRSFRESLFVHAERAPLIRYEPDPTRLGPLHFAAWTPPVGGPTVIDHTRQEYEVADGATLFTNDPGLKAALEVLNDRWPWTLSRRELTDAVHARLVAAGLAPSADLPGHVDNLMRVLMVQGQVRYRLDPVLPLLVSSEMPRLDEPIRRMTELTRADGDASIFNVWHEPLMLSPVDRCLLPLLDGTRDRNGLLDVLVSANHDEALGMATDALAEYVDGLLDHLVELKLVRVR